jgi:transglutaminase-like putative cysteine protease
MLSRTTGLCFLLILISAPALAAGDEAPAWLQQAAARQVPSYEKDTAAVILHSEQQVTVSDDGKITTVTTFAIRILLREGRNYARAVALYNSDAGKVREIRAWLIRTSTPVKRYGKDETIDIIENVNDIYNESRLKLIDATRDADVGTVFGYQTISEERSVFSQDIFSFQDNRLPILASRYSLALPQGWRASGFTFNHAPVEPTISGTNYTWELRDIPPITWEPNSPEVSSLAPRLAVSYFPPGDNRAASMQTNANWVEVSRWLSGLHDSQWAPDAAITEKVRQLTAGAKTELEKIHAIGHYVQNIRYISIQIGLNRGGGMRPHTAAEVFAKSYGDCKDKANLMRAMLKVLDIAAYPVAIYAGDPTFVKEEWVSPHQFNHCIIAIKVNDETLSPTIVAHAKLGRLLIFDATDDDTPVGGLPEHEQGSLALVVAGDEGALMRMPVTPPEANGLDRQIQATLAADGSITANIRESFLGTSAADSRNEFRRGSKLDFLKIVEGWISRGATAAKVSNLEPKDNQAQGRFDLSVDFSAPGYGQLMQDRLLVFKPAIVARREALALTEPKRKYPVVLGSNAFTETVRMKLPVGFEVDELPDAVKLDTAFGSYKTSYEVKNGELIFTRALAQRATTIPSEHYQSVRSFFEKMRAAEQAPVVLARK